MWAQTGRPLFPNLPGGERTLRPYVWGAYEGDSESVRETVRAKEEARRAYLETEEGRREVEAWRREMERGRETA